MQKHSLSVGLTPLVMVRSVGGDLRLSGWDSAELMAKTDGELLDIRESGNNYTVACDSDLILSLPRAAVVQIEEVSGDADLRNNTGKISIESVLGDLSLRNVAEIEANAAHGDLIVRNASGACRFENTYGDASFRNLQQGLVVRQVGADLYLRDVYGDVEASAHGSAVIYARPEPGSTTNVKALGDILLRLMPDTDVELELDGADVSQVRLDVGEQPEIESLPFRTVLGSGASKIKLHALGELVVTQRAEQWESVNESSDPSGGRKRTIHFEIPDVPIPPDLDDRISRKVEAAMKRVDRMQDRVQARVQAKVDAAMGRAERQIRMAERRSRRADIRQGAHMHPPFSTPPEADEPVTEDERLVILKMLQEKKISLEEAEMLLNALEGK